ncbi:RNA polymerase sigma factor SigJ [Streptomyces stelliscabiei]|uniref:RNA polymerase sigma-70 factor (ECF subfamily) n=2 Tax=Streptomyces stelliscabiei TaxID=146820 RepID=A0A8I0PIB7_9ACTN|nr:RNA polymerase sigma factor SigJ [Streptomyces stelliscabiei]MBE1602028.1 RNA polymerase sigma-70 factor (ECF subfamily) [Streptomyces stelliscabiei]MDX2514244.1 RNA polymerase sigma factor SigJ [Streptomyces stelliscabiei]MDX2552492.1 RNA polymerase sigma factor SigJ [Streptomyces stelliscabiei]MDX2611887.1 RNA polymerase sigma factor SigJ [Streptomyces stelliscabiei]MDX2637234.1 RNA polymerase sigma factor SigJ [Streptomyces stelliscabiei]
MAAVGTGTDAAEGERGRLVNVAYRLLGSVTEAEDAVQDAYARWYGLSRSRQEEIRSPGAWLTTVTGRVCLDVLGSARVRRERYVGVWLPEPLPGRAGRDRAGGTGPGGAADPADPADLIVLDESVDMALLVVLESMTPAERVAFVLHDVFRYPFAEIADVLGRTPAACKQLAASARRRVGAASAPAAPVTASGRAEVVRRVKEAWEAKDIATLVALLDPSAVLTADGGGTVGAVLRPVEGGARIARYLVAIADMAPGLELLERSVNGVPGLVARRAGAVTTVAAFDVSDGHVTRIWAVRNPEKLRPWAREGGL